MWPLGISLSIFFACMALIGWSGVKLTAVADQLADETGLGEAIMGAVFIGAITSLSGSILSVTTAWDNHPQFAVNNAVGGMGLQLTFLAIADMTYRKANLEHAAASQENLMQSGLLILLLTLPLMAASGPDISFAGIHPFSILLLFSYFFGIREISRSRKNPMWKPRLTRETVVDEPKRSKASKKEILQLWAWLLFLAPVVGVAGWALGKAGVSIAEHTQISETLVGGIFTAGTTSIPELVIALAAVRRGALSLAVGDIIGGNTFDTLILAGSDIAYRKGSIYHAIGSDQFFLLSLTLLLSAILMLGLLKREKHGIGNIGFESILMLVLYLGGFAFLMLSR